MFIFGIFGVQNKSKILKEYNNVICTCGRFSKMVLIQEYMYFHFFFIPIIKWGKKYFLEARCCGRVFEVPDDYVDELLRSEIIDFNRVREVNTPYRVCPNCNQYVDRNFMYCPHCGSKL